VLRDLLLPLVFRFVVTDRSLAWICDHHLDWDAPATAEATIPGHPAGPYQ
jgi:hypothetical protein